MNLQKLVYDTIMELGECSISEILAKMGKDISAAHAASAGRCCRRFHRWQGKLTRTPVMEQGRHYLVGASVSRLYNKGKIRRVRKGVYAPLLPQLFRTG